MDIDPMRPVGDSRAKRPLRIDGHQNQDDVERLWISQCLHKSLMNQQLSTHNVSYVKLGRQKAITPLWRVEGMLLGFFLDFDSTT
jgi:hypothetical protein